MKTYLLSLVLLGFSHIGWTQSNSNYHCSNIEEGVDKLFQTKDYQGAIVAFNKALVEIYSLRAVAKSLSNDKYGAIDDASKAIELNPYLDLTTIFGRGMNRAQINDLQGALYDYDTVIEAIDSNPKCLESGLLPLVLYERGCVKVKSLNYRGACADFGRAVQLGLHASDEIKKHCKQ